MTKEQDTAMFDQPDPEVLWQRWRQANVLFERWIVSAEHLAGHELDLESAETGWYAGLTPEQYVTSLAPACKTCQTPGAPPHEPSARCHNGGRVAHCTCRACFG